MPSLQAITARIVKAAWFSSATWPIAAGTCTHCKDRHWTSGPASTVYTGFSNRHSPSPVPWSYKSSLRRAQMRRSCMSAGRTVFGWLRAGPASWSCGTWGIPSAGAGALLGPWLEALVGSAAGLPDGMSLLDRCSSRSPGTWSRCSSPGSVQSRAAARCSSCRTRIWPHGKCPASCGTFGSHCGQMTAEDRM